MEAGIAQCHQKEYWIYNSKKLFLASSLSFDLEATTRCNLPLMKKSLSLCRLECLPAWHKTVCSRYKSKLWIYVSPSTSGCLLQAKDCLKNVNPYNTSQDLTTKRCKQQLMILQKLQNEERYRFKGNKKPLSLLSESGFSRLTTRCNQTVMVTYWKSSRAPQAEGLGNVGVAWYTDPEEAPPLWKEWHIAEVLLPNRSQWRWQLPWFQAKPRKRDEERDEGASSDLPKLT